MKTTASQLLKKADSLLEQRGQQYDKPEGERSMAKTVLAFNAVTGRQLKESDGWLLLSILKMVRDNQREMAHQDSCEDFVAYSALYGESRLNGNETMQKLKEIEGDDIFERALGPCGK